MKTQTKSTKLYILLLDEQEIFFTTLNEAIRYAEKHTDSYYYTTATIYEANDTVELTQEEIETIEENGQLDMLELEYNNIIWEKGDK